MINILWKNLHLVCKLQILIDKELEDLSFIYFTSPIDRASKEITGSPKILNLPTSLTSNSLVLRVKNEKNTTSK